ncbi:MAG TPA: hypothetical protein VGY48_31765, partial [Vicinamibacterales bacterium]|nr:hypothetical protein [Vicinamibacterales bacterium]
MASITKLLVVGRWRRRNRVFLVVVALCNVSFVRTPPATAQATVASPVEDVVSTWYPIQPGDTWFYQKESEEGGNTGGMAHPMIERWKTEETIASVTTISEGTFVTKRTNVLDHVTLNGWLKANNRTKHELPESHILIRQNC